MLGNEPLRQINVSDAIVNWTVIVSHITRNSMEDADCISEWVRMCYFDTLSAYHSCSKYFSRYCR
jgi:hypothetical protein